MLPIALFALARPLLALAQTEVPTLQPTPTLAAPAGNAVPPGESAPIPRVHVVQEGENLTTIAADYGVTVEEILAVNALANGDVLQVGQTLVIPGGIGEAVATVYAVRPGDTVRSIAWDFNTTVDEVIAANKLIQSSPPLLTGQQVSLISRTGSGSPVPATGKPHLVAPGETLLLIAARYGVTPEVLAELNGQTEHAPVFSGQRLRIPDDAARYRDLPEGWVDVQINPEAAAQGMTLSIFVDNLLAGRPAGRFGDQPLFFAPHEDGYVALVGIDAFAEPGDYELELSGGDEQHLWAPLRVLVPVAETAYETQYVTVDEALDGLLDPAVRAGEDAFLEGIYADFDETQRWSVGFQSPITTTVVTAGYGGRRSYNGGPVEIYHTGVDYAAPEGQPVLAPADGVVVFSDELELRGGVVIIDHGLGVMTGYYHLLERAVQSGDAVTAGQIIGRVGTTGLSSGPHLHWDLRIMNVPVDPLQWLERAFP